MRRVCVRMGVSTGVAPGRWDVAQVTTCHSYEIFAKYRFGCSTCGHEFARHSKSLDLTRKGCGVCRGKLSFLGAFNRDGTPVKAREPTAFAKYVGEHFSALKKARPVASHKELMGELGTRFREARAGGDGGDGGGSHAPLSNAFECIEVDSDGSASCARAQPGRTRLPPAARLALRPWASRSSWTEHPPLTARPLEPFTA